MALTAVQLAALRSEFVNNPASMPYLAFTEENVVANAEIINNATGANPRTVNRDYISSADIRAAITYAAFDGLTVAEEAYVRFMCMGETLAVNTDTLKTFAAIGGSSIWASADKAVMDPRMQSLMQYQGSRAQEIRGTIGVSSVSPSDIRDAVNLQ